MLAAASASLDVLEPHRQVHNADPRTNIVTCLAKEADPEILSALADDGSDLRKHVWRAEH